MLKRCLQFVFNNFAFILAPISNFTASGQIWLEHGNILNLNIKCKGSSKVQYCYNVYDGELDFFLFKC